MTRDPDIYPAYSLAERIADGTVHGFGVALAITGGILLIVFGATATDGSMVAGLSVYAAALMAVGLNFGLVVGLIAGLVTFNWLKNRFVRLDAKAFPTKLLRKQL